MYLLWPRHPNLYKIIIRSQNKSSGSGRKATVEGGSCPVEGGSVSVVRLQANCWRRPRVLSMCQDHWRSGWPQPVSFPALHSLLHILQLSPVSVLQLSHLPRVRCLTLVFIFSENTDQPPASKGEAANSTSPSIWWTSEDQEWKGGEFSRRLTIPSLMFLGKGIKMATHLGRRDTAREV